MKLDQKVSKHNYRSYLWHIVFFSMAINFMDFDTVIPSMIIQSGGSAFQVGLLTAILVGGAKFAQFFAAPFLFFRKNKKPFLILGVSIRFIALFAIAASFFFSSELPDGLIIYMIFFFISFFSISEAFASLSYTDILGKSILPEKRKGFLSIRQVISSILIFISAFAVKEVLQLYDFPRNYSVLFLFAGISLAVASLGFWNLKEVTVERMEERSGLNYFFQSLKKELKSNKVLWSYLIIINTLGIGMGLLPFMILYAKTNIGLEASIVGNFVILKTIGLVASGLILFRFASRLGYRKLLYTAVTVGTMIPVYGIIFKTNTFFYPIVFLMGGIFITFFNISRAGVLLEISTNTNRILYAGIAGIGSVLVTVFPLMAGLVIELIGFDFFLVLISLTMLVSVFFIHRLRE